MLKKYFLTGLAIFLPIVATLAILGWVIRLLTNPFIGGVSRLLEQFNIINTGFLFLSPEETIRLGSQLLILIFLFFFIVLLGAVTRFFFVTSLLDLGDRTLQRIPIVRSIYKTLREIVQSLFSPDSKSFNQVALVPFPQPGVYAIGLVAGDAPASCSKALNEELISVLIPTTPTPTAGYTLMYKKRDLIYLDMKPDEAIKYIISCGMIIPKEHA